MNKTHPQANKSPLSADEALVVQAYVIGVSLPLFCCKGTSHTLLGTATLFEIAGRHFIITASHLFDYCDGENFSYPDKKMNVYWTLGKFVRVRPIQSDIDVCVLELLSKDAIARLKSQWQFLTPKNVGGASNRGTFLVAGYPLALGRQTGKPNQPKHVTIISQRMLKIPRDANPPPDPKVDLFFYHDEAAPTVSGVAGQVPDMRGMSGASIWEIYSSKRLEFWTPESALRVIGIQSAYRKGEYFRGKSWAAVAATLTAHDKNLGKEIYGR